MAKNEEQFIESCIQSCLYIASEIILLDTGSTDKTLEIAKKYPIVKIYHDIWENYDSKTRNKCISYASSDWILVLDADERLEENVKEKLEYWIAKYQNELQPFAISFKSHTPDKEDFILNYSKSVLFKNDGKVKYIRPIHDHPHAQGIVYFESNIVIHHDCNLREKNRTIKKHQDYIQRIIKVIEENDNPDDNYYYYRHLGDSFYEIENYNESLRYYIHSFNLFQNTGISKENNYFYENSILRIIRVLLGINKDYKNSLFYLNELKKYFPKSNAGIFYQAYLLLRLGDITQSIILYKSLIKDMDKSLFKLNIIIELSRAYYLKNNKEKCLSILEQSFSEYNDNLCKIHLMKFYILENKINKAIQIHYNNNIPKNINIENFKSSFISSFVKIEGWENFEISQMKYALSLQPYYS